MTQRSPDMNCSVARALGQVGDTWTFLVLRAAFLGKRRFSEIQGSLGISRNRLSERLSHMVESGLLKEAPYSGARFEYRLTPKSLDLFPALVLLNAWGERWLPGEPSATVALRHRCGRPFDPRAVCTACGKRVKPSEVRYVDGPGAGRSQNASVRRTRRSTVTAAFQGEQDSPLARALSVVGDKWAFLLLRELFFGATRFEEFLSHIGAARNILTDRLNRLLTNGVIKREPYQTNPIRYDYKLSASGLALYDPIVALIHWGDTWLAESHGKPLKLMHTRCDHEFSPSLVCGHCGDSVSVHDVTPLSAPIAEHSLDR